MSSLFLARLFQCVNLCDNEGAGNGGTQAVELIYGILIVEDLLGVVMIVLLTKHRVDRRSRGAVDADLDRSYWFW